MSNKAFAIAMANTIPKGPKGDKGDTGGTDTVNGKSGTVVLDAGDLEYDSSETYTSGTVGAEISDVKSEISDGFIQSQNLFDKNNVVTGKTLLGSSGHYINDFQDATNWCVSNIFPVDYEATYTFNSLFDTSTARVCFYDADGLYKGSANGTENEDGTYSVTYPDASIRYGRFAYKTTVMNADTFMLVKGTTFPSTYVPFGKILNPSYVEQQIEDAIDDYDPNIGTANIQDRAVTIPKVTFIEHDPETNFIDRTALIDGKYIDAHGVEKSASDWYCTDYIRLTPGEKYYKNDYVYKSYYGFYDASKSVVGCSADDGDLGDNLGIFTFPNDAVYARFSFNGGINAQNLAFVSINSGTPKEYGYRLVVQNDFPTDYTGKEISVFNKILCIGDSITFGGYNSDTSISVEDTEDLSAKYSYPTALEKISGVQTTNKGDSGKSSSTWYTAHSADDLSGHDCCIIELGINDGTWGTTSETAMTNIINKVKTENNSIKIFVSTIPNGQSYVSDNYKATSTAIRNFVEGLNDDDVILLDEATYGHLQSSKGYNAGHLTAYGYWRLAQDYANYISWYIHNNMDDFRFVQFTGTNYTYSN